MRLSRAGTVDMSSGSTLLASNATGTQKRKLNRLLADVKKNVPLYERLYSNVELGERNLTLPQMLAQLPVISKGDLLDAPLEERTDRRYDRTILIEESTTGSTGQPFSMYVEKAYIRRRNLRFLLGLVSSGFRPWQRLMLLTDRHSDSTRTTLNRHYVSVEQSTAEIMRAYLKIRPHVLYGFLTPLRLLAERLSDAPRSSHQPQLVVSTAEMLDRFTKQTLENTFDCPVCDFYGLTEMGLVAWQPPRAERYIVWSNSVLTELIPDSTGQDRYRMIMTNLDLHASPIIRFDSGDLASVRWVGAEPIIMAIEGRRIDTIIKSDGSQLSPYRITDALRDVSGVKRFKITQHTVTDLEIKLDVHPDSRENCEQRVRVLFARLLGDDLKVTIQFRSDLLPEGTRKFRPIESHVERT